MPTFGQYETAQRLFLSGVGGIYALKSDDKKIIKVLHPPVGIWTDDRIQEEIDGFRLRAKIQKNLAKNSRFWAPIHDSAAIRDSQSSPAESQSPDTSEAEAASGSRIDSITGETEGRPVANGAFAVMDRYERSLQSLLDGRITILNADLRTILSGIIQGLLDLKKTAGRPHGALKPTNVLLANSTNLSAATVHLSDPCPDGALTAKSAEKDLADIARILYHLVNRRAYDEGTIGRNKDWNALGPNGEDWRALCNHFLDPQAPAEERDLEKVLARIATWTKKPQRSRAPLIAAAVMLVLAGGGVGAYYKFRTPPVQFNPEKWQYETLSYYGWYEHFADEVAAGEYHAQFGGTTPKDPKDPAFPLIVPILDKNKADPAHIIRDVLQNTKDWTDVKWETFIGAPTDDVVKPPGPKNTEAGYDQIKAVENAIRNWPVLVQIDGAAKRYGDLKWKKAADRLSEISQNALPPAIPEPANKAAPDEDFHERFKAVKAIHDRAASIAAGIAKADSTVKTVNSIDQHWKQISDQRTTLHVEGKGVPLFDNLQQFLEEFPNAAIAGDDPNKDVLAALNDSLVRVDDLLKTLAAALSARNGEVDFAQLATDPLARATPSVEAYENLAKAVSGYVKLDPDPRKALRTQWEAKANTDNLNLYLNALESAARANVAGVQDDLNGLTKRKLKLDDLMKIIAGVSPNGQPVTDPDAVPADADFTKEDIDNWRLPAIAKNQARIKAVADKATTLKQTLVDNAMKRSEPFREPWDKFWARKEAEHSSSPVAKATKPVADAWDAAFKAFVKKTRDDKANVDRQSDVSFRQLIENKCKQIDDVFGKIDASIPAQVPGLSDLNGPAWQRDIAREVATVWRETALKHIVQDAPLPLKDDVPDLLESNFAGHMQGQVTGFENARKESLEVIADYTGISNGLLQLELRPDEAPAQENWDKLAAKKNADPVRKALLADTVIAKALAPIAGQVAALRETESKTTYPALLQDAAKSPTPEIALAAWRKLGTAKATLDDVKTLQVALDNEEQAERNLQDRIKALAGLTPARAAKLLQDIQSERPVRWKAWSRLAASDDDIATLVDTAPKWSVTIDLQSDKNLYFYKCLFQLRADFRSHPNDEKALTASANTFRTVLADPALTDIASLPAVASMLADLQKAIQGNQGNSTTKQGPQWAGWTPQPSPTDQVRIFKSPTGSETLEFQKITVEEPDKQSHVIYLCTTEMSVGVFAEALNRHAASQGGKLDEVNNEKQSSGHWFDVPATKADDDYYVKGIRSWCITGGRFDANSNWIDVTGPSYPTDLKDPYPAGAVPASPTRKHPVQLISPWAAMYTAELLGCRLPTSAEWTQAYHDFEDKDGLPKNLWNLRGKGAGPASWQTQNDHAAKFGRSLLDENIFKADPKNAAFQDQPWTFESLIAKVPGASRRLQGSGEYTGSTLWFLPVQTEQTPAGSAVQPVMHHLVGNVAEYVFDALDSIKPIEEFNPTPAAVDKALAADKDKVAVIGGSSLSQPDNPFNVSQPVNLTSLAAKTGYSDVGLRLAYTEPQETVAGVLRRVFDAAKSLPGPRSR